jgi:hypothetical protein
MSKHIHHPLPDPKHLWDTATAFYVYLAAAAGSVTATLGKIFGSFGKMSQWIKSHRKAREYEIDRRTGEMKEIKRKRK